MGPGSSEVPAADTARLQDDLEALAGIGRGEDHGLYRAAFSPAWDEARRWLMAKGAEAGLEVAEDAALNVRLTLPGRDRGLAAVATGSHLDTVPGGGPLDGALGVVAGLECLRRLGEAGARRQRDIELYAFTDEEGRFGGMLGSQALAGTLTPERVLGAVDSSGLRLADVLAARGLEPLQVLRARRPPGSWRAFVELHIEQGPVLERSAARLGVVEGIVGLFKWDVRLLGEANHAGTTPMDARRDAFAGLAEFARRLADLLEELGGPTSRANIGRVRLFPGAANVVPGCAEFSLEARDLDPAVLARLADGFRRTLSAIARRRGLMFEFEVKSEIAPVACDPELVAHVEQVARDLDPRAMRLPSGAAHDAQALAALAPIAMLFVPSQAGRSHHPAEWTAWEDIELGANALLVCLASLSRSTR